MKFIGMTVGALAVLAAGSASATEVFNTLNTLATPGVVYDSRNWSVGPGGLGTPGSPLADSFDATGGTAINSVTLRLSKPSEASDNGSILVYLVPDQVFTGNHTPMSSLGGTALATAGRVFLGSIPDNDLSPVGPTNVQLNTWGLLPGVGTQKYWIALASASDTANGGPGGVVASTARWWVLNSLTNSPTTAGHFTAGNFNEHVQGTDGKSVVVSDLGTNATFEMQVDAPEPASLALLGAGLAGLGFARRRKDKTEKA